MVVARYSRRAFLAIGAGSVAAAATYRRIAASPSAPVLVHDGSALADGFFDHCQLVERDGLLAVAGGPAGGMYVGAPWRLPAGTTHAGLRWRTTGEGAGPRFDVRMASADGSWGAWRAVHVEASPGERSAEWFASLVYSAGMRQLQYRVEFGPSPSAAVTRVAASAVASPVWDEDVRAAAQQATATGSTAPSTTPSPTATPSATGTATPVRRIRLPGLAGETGPARAEPGFALDATSGTVLRVTPREEWGADESYRFRTSGAERWHEMFVPFQKLAVHHTAARNSYSPEEAPAEMRAIYNYHANEHGWGDIGYNALIDRWGRIYEGRHGRGGDPGDAFGRRELLSAGVSGGHAKWHNYGGAGVALIGNSDDAGWWMWDEAGPMWGSLVDYAAFVCREAGISPLSNDGTEVAVSDFLQSDDRWHLAAENVGGHIAFEQTFCPGGPVRNLLPALRRAIDARIPAARQANVALTMALPDALEARTGTRLRAAWSVAPPGDAFAFAGCEFRWEAWFKPEEEDDIVYLNGFSNDFQPVPRWQQAPAGLGATEITASHPGHYTVQVRPVLRQGGAFVRGSVVSRTWLVRD
jgi:hypothetical protein